MAGAAFTLLIGFAPALPEVVEAIQELEVETSTRDAGVFRLRLAIARTAMGDWTILEKDLFRPLVPVSIRIAADGAGVPEAVLNGYVTGQNATYGEEPGTASLEVTGMDVTLLMNLQEKVMPWPNMPDHAIAVSILGQYGLIARVQPTPPQLVEPEGTTTQRGTDARFLRRIAARNGFQFYVQPEPISGLDLGYFEPPQVGPGLPQAVLNVNMGPETNVLDFRVSYDMVQPTGVIATGLDVATKAVQPAPALASVQPPLGIEPALPRVVPPPVVRMADTGLARAAELQPAAQAIVDASSFAIRASGTVMPDVGILRPGGIVNIRGAGRVFSGSYYVTRVTHHISKDGGHTQRFEAMRNAVGLTGAEVFF